MNISGVILILAGLFEIGWPLGVKNGYTDQGIRWEWITFSGICMMISGAMLFYAQKTIPIGTAYAVWTGIGAAGTFGLGIALFGDALSVMRMISVLPIIVGVIGLKLAS